MLTSSACVANFERFEPDVHTVSSESQFRGGAAKFQREFRVLLLCKSVGKLQHLPRLSAAMRTGKTERLPPAEDERHSQAAGEEWCVDLRSTG